MPPVSSAPGMALAFTLCCPALRPPSRPRAHHLVPFGSGHACSLPAPSDSKPPRHIPLVPVSIDPPPSVLQCVLLVEVCAGSPASARLARKEVVFAAGVCPSSRHPPPLPVVSTGPRLSAPLTCVPSSSSRHTCHEGREPVCWGQRGFSRAWRVVGTHRIHFE